MVQIAVAGSAHRLVPAERGTLHLRLSLESPDREAAIDGVTALHRRFSAEAEEHVRAGAATRWSSEQVSAWPQRRYEKDSEVASVFHVAAAEVRVRFRDFAALGAWVVSAGSEPGCTIGGIDWTLTERRRASEQREIRVLAVADATDRAEAYAAAIGAEGVELERLWEPGLRPSASGGGGGPELRAMMATGGGDGIELRPDDIEVEAAVTADFVTR